LNVVNRNDGRTDQSPRPRRARPWSVRTAQNPVCPAIRLVPDLSSSPQRLLREHVPA
jgi:hypothetical protein